MLKLDPTHNTATVVHQYTHNPPLNVSTQGSLETLPNGDAFIGWGALPYYSEYTAAGKLLYDVTMPLADESYRAFRLPWTGTPYYAPRIAARRSRGKNVVYASWNGATEVALWKVLAGSGARKLVPVVTAPRTGFETAIRATAAGPYFRVQALDSSGRLLSSSGVVHVTAGAPDGARPARNAAATVVGTSRAKIGVILVDSRGHTLYLFTGSRCSGGCAGVWSPLPATGSLQAAKGSGVSTSLLGRTRRSNGQDQVTYNHHALYLFSNDKRAGQLGGEGAHQFGGFWYAVGTRGNAIKPKKTNPGGGSVCNPLCPGY